MGEAFSAFARAAPISATPSGYVTILATELKNPKCTELIKQLTSLVLACYHMNDNGRIRIAIKVDRQDPCLIR